MKLDKVIKYTGTMELVSGLAIKGTSNDLNIGGVDSEVIKNPITKMPYIPGSSLKGKMRSLMEHAHADKIESRDGSPCRCGKKECIICTVFGAHMNPHAASAPTRIIVRDCNLTEESRNLIQNLPLTSGSFLEQKAENIINRENGTAGSPRFIERIPSGLSFDVEIILQIFNGDDEDKLKKTVNEALNRLQDESYLGGSGSRGYGQVRFTGKWSDEDAAV